MRLSGETLNIPESLLSNGDTLAREIARRWVEMYTSKDERRNEVRELQQYLYATSTQTTTNQQNDFDHTTHRPKLTQIYDTLIAIYMEALIPFDSFMSFDPEEEDAADKDKREKIISYLTTKHRQNGFKEIVRELITDWIEQGECIAGVDWVRQTKFDENGGEQVVFEGPKPSRTDPDDAVFHQSAKNWDVAPKFFRIFTDLGTLEKEAQRTPPESRFRDVINKIIQERGDLAAFAAVGGDSVQSSYEEINKHYTFLDAGYGSYTNYLESGSVELIFCYADIFNPDTRELISNKEVVVIDRKWVLDIKSVETWTGQPIRFHSTWRKRSNMLSGMGPLDNLVGLQFRINHLENTQADRFDDLAYPDLVMSQDTQIETDEDGRRMYRIVEGGSVGPINQDTTALTANLRIPEIEQSMEEYAGVPREAAGQRSPGEKTKFEVEELLSASTRLFIDKVEKFEKEILGPMMEAEVEWARRKLGAGEDVVRVTSEDGLITFIKITRDDLLLKGKIQPMGASNFRRRAILAQEITTLMNATAVDQEVRQHLSSKKLAELLAQALEQKGLFRPYVRVGEALERDRMVQAAQTVSDAQSDTLPGEENEAINTPT